MAQAWRDSRGGILLLLSGDDYTAKEFWENANADDAWNGLLVKSNVARHELPEADHTFSDSASRERAEELTMEWLHGLNIRW
jgi:hypothetical protein